MSRVEHLVFSDGERYSMLVDDEGMPDFWTTLFITTFVRPNGGQNTITSYIGAIRHYLLWEQIKGRNVLSEFKRGKFLDAVDAISLRDFCLLKTTEVRKWHKRTESTIARRALDDFPSVPRNLGSLEGKAARIRYTRIVEFLAFVATTVLRQRPNVAQINKQIQEMKDKLLANKPKGVGSRKNGYDPNEKAPPPKIFNAFLEAVHFDSPNNPYKHRISRKRNELLFNVMAQTGIRSSEALALKLEDIDMHEYLICVVRRHDDPDDPRTRQPVPKTSERKIPVKKELIRKIRDYIMEERARTKNANKHPFLFVTHHKGKHLGQPLSNSGFLKILSSAVNKIAKLADTYDDEVLFKDIKRHGFRHNFNYILSKRFDEHNEKAKNDPSLTTLTEKKQNQIRMYLNGWADEKTAETYSRRFIVEQARKIMREDMEQQSKALRGIHEQLS